MTKLEDLNYIYLRKAVTEAINDIDEELSLDFSELYNVNGIEKEFVFGPKPKVLLEIEVKIFDKHNQTWDVLRTFNPVWLKHDTDIMENLNPIFDEIRDIVGHVDFLHVHCKNM